MELVKPEKVDVVLTGGHAATTAVAVIEEILAENLNWKLYWIGVKNAIEGKKVLTLESEILPKLGVKFLCLTTGRMQRRFTRYTVPSIIKIPFGIAQAFYYLKKIDPTVVLSFGGFAAFPVVLSAKILGIPVVVHEQTSVAGRANLLSAKYATVIAVSRKESIKYYPSQKCVVTGNPVMKEIMAIKPLSSLGSPPVIFITGGSRGSRTINETVEQILKKLLSKYKLIHQTGELDYLKFSNYKQKLPQALRDNYEVFIRFSPLEIHKIYQMSNIVVARSGANTVSEIIAAKRPAVLIPLPFSFMDEQTKNAAVAKDWGIARIIKQDTLTPELLLKNIEKTAEEYSNIIERIKDKQSPDLGSSKKLVEILRKYVK